MPRGPEGFNPIELDEFDARNSVFGDADQQLKYNELSHKATLGQLTREEKEELDSLEATRQGLAGLPISAEENEWLTEYLTNQGKIDFSPSRDERRRFMELNRRKDKLGIADEDEAAGLAA